MVWETWDGRGRMLLMILIKECMGGCGKARKMLEQPNARRSCPWVGGQASSGPDRCHSGTHCPEEVKGSSLSPSLAPGGQRAPGQPVAGVASGVGGVVGVAAAAAPAAPYDASPAPEGRGGCARPCWPGR